MKVRFSVYLFYLLTIIHIVSCESNGCFEKGGTEVREEIHITTYTEMSAYGIFDLVLVPDTLDYVEFLARESVLPHLKAKVEDEIMVLENSNSCFYQRDHGKVKAYIHYKSLEKINLYEPCKLTTAYPIENSMSLVVQADMAEVDIEINADLFYFYNHTTTGGKYTFGGYAHYASIAGYYTAQFNLDKLKVQHLKLNNSSICDMYVNPLEKLDVQIHHEGNIYYTGFPEITIDGISGSGQLIQIQ